MKYLLEKVWKGWNWKWSLKLRKKSASLKGKKYGHSELARHQKYVRINNKAAILSWYDGFEGAMTQGKPPKKGVPTPRPAHARKSCRCPAVPAGWQYYIRWEHFLWLMVSVCLKPEHLLVFIVFHLTLLLQTPSSFLRMPNLSEPSLTIWSNYPMIQCLKWIARFKKKSLLLV